MLPRILELERTGVFQTAKQRALFRNEIRIRIPVPKTGKSITLAPPWTHFPS